MSFEFEYNFNKFHIRHDLLLTYLQSTGWNKIKEKNGNILYHYNIPATFPIPLVVPNPKSIDIQLRMVDLIKTLEAIEKIPGEQVIEAINNVRKDVWKISIAKGSNIHSLGVEQFRIIALNIKKIIEYSASAEQNARPYYENTLSVGTEYSKKCRVGHTFRGSYGITIEAPIDEWEIPVGNESPLGRRVTERIFNSLKLVEEESDFEDITPIYEKYLNGNMCLALIDLLKASNGDIEYSVMASPIWEVSENIKDNPTVLIKHSNIFYLNEVYNRMHNEVELIDGANVIGIITELNHDFQENENDSDYNIIIYGSHNNRRKHEYHVVLRKDDYLKACLIHAFCVKEKKEKLVEISGNLRRTKKKWYIDSYSNFEEIGDLRANNAQKDKSQFKLFDF